MAAHLCADDAGRDLPDSTGFRCVPIGTRLSFAGAVAVIVLLIAGCGGDVAPIPSQGPAGTPGAPGDVDATPTDGGEAAAVTENARPLSSDLVAIRQLERILENQLAAGTVQGISFGDSLVVNSLSGLSYTYYNLQIPLDGVISMYEATRRSDLLVLALELAENMVASARDRDGDGHPEWDGSLYGVPPPDGKPDRLLPDLQGALPLARLARLILTDGTLSGQYGDRANALARFVSHDIVDKWLVTRGNLDWFLRLPAWSDKASMLTRLLADLYAATGREDRRALAEVLAEQFIATVLVYDPELDTYTWPTVDAPDTSHTNREAFMIEVLARTGIAFNDDDVRRVGNTFTRLIWNGSFNDPRCANYHTGLNDALDWRGPWGGGLVYNGWVLSGRVHPTAQRVGRSIVRLTQSNPQINPTVLYSSSPGQVIAFCGHLARNLRPMDGTATVPFGEPQSFEPVGF